jgi:hypothetical protein
MNLISRLLGRRQEPVSEPSPYVLWTGQSGKHYQYEILPIDASFRALPGNYIYARQEEDGTWVPIYIAQTRDLHQRLEGHVRTDDAIASGATHLHAHYDTAGQAARCSEEHDLIVRWQPVCNEKVEV